MNSRKTILVLVDDQEVKSLFVRTLGMKGFEVISSASADEAVDWAKEIDPDLIFMNLLLPGSNGLKVSKAIHSHEKLKNVPIIMLTNYHGELDPKYTSTIGVIDVLVKPFSPDDILSKTREVLGAEAFLNEPAAPELRMESESAEPSQEEGPEIYSIEEEFSEIDSIDSVRPVAPEREEEAGFNVPALSEELLEKESIQDRSHEETDAGIEDYDFSDFEAATESAGADREKYDPELKHETDPDETDTEQDFTYEEEPEKGKLSIKKIAVLVSAVVIIALVGIGAYNLKDFTSRRSGAKAQKARVIAQSAPKANENGPVPTPVNPAPSPMPAPTPGKDEKIVAAAQSKSLSETSARRDPEKSFVKDNANRKTVGSKPRKATYSVQTGFFGDHKNALTFAESLNGKGYEAYVYPDQAKKANRVLVGKFDDRKKAAEQMQKMSSQGIKAVVFVY